MYSPRNSYNSPPPELSNNPFINHPANALTRYPDIDGSDDPTGDPAYTSWLQSTGSSPAGAPTGYPPQGYGGAYQQQPQQTGWNGGYAQQPAQGYAPPMQQPHMTGQPFQPSSSFGQQLSAQVNSPYGGVPQQPQQQQYSGYQQPQPQYGSGGYQQQPGYAPAPTPNAPYLAEFDPYAQLGQAQASGGFGAPPGGQHPREYVQQHKLELEQWDGYTWKQAQNSFDALKEAWGARKREVEARARQMGGAGLFGGGGYGGMYGGQAQEAARLESLAKQAESNHDSVAASSFQMQEVYTGYRQSGDLASKRRVREAINAALTSLPDWPPQQW